MTKYEAFIQKQKAKYPNKFSDEKLNPAFVTAFNNGDTFRVLADLGYEKPIWGYIGVTTGWQPVFLLMRRRGSLGSSETISCEDKIVKTRILKA